MFQLTSSGEAFHKETWKSASGERWEGFEPCHCHSHVGCITAKGTSPGPAMLTRTGISQKLPPEEGGACLNFLEGQWKCSWALPSCQGSWPLSQRIVESYLLQRLSNDRTSLLYLNWEQRQWCLSPLPHFVLVHVIPYPPRVASLSFLLWNSLLIRVCFTWWGVLKAAKVSPVCLHPDALLTPHTATAYRLSQQLPWLQLPPAYRWARSLSPAYPSHLNSTLVHPPACYTFPLGCQIWNTSGSHGGSHL